MATRTYRELAWNKFLEVVDEAANAASAQPSLPAILPDLRARFDAAIGAVPGLAALLDRPQATAPTSTEVAADGADEVIDPINRADDIVAHIAGKLHER